MEILIGIWRLTLFVAWTAFLIPVQAIALALRSPLSRTIPRLYHRVCARILGFKVVVHGCPATTEPILFVSNHASYLDVTVLGSVIEGSFVAKSEVGSWPLFGLLAKLQRTVFVERKARSTVERQRDEIGRRLEEGDNLILFPEGTSSDGNRVLPFKTALFAVAAVRPRGNPLTVQPVSVAATRLDGLPMGVSGRPLYAWYGDMGLSPHLWAVMRSGSITVEIDFHEPVTIDGLTSRKALAEHCRRVVALGVSRAVSGRRGEAPPAPQDAGTTREGSA